MTLLIFLSVFQFVLDFGYTLVEAVDGSSVIGFPDNGEAEDGPSGGGS